MCFGCFLLLFFLMIRRPPRSTRTDTLCPYTTLFRSQDKSGPALNRAGFLRVFAAATAIQIPKQDLAALIRSAAALGTRSGIALTTPTVDRKSTRLNSSH